jgi:hypothetical protein
MLTRVAPVGAPRPPRRRLSRDECLWRRGRVGETGDRTRLRHQPVGCLYFAAVIDSTVIFFVFGSSVPITFTFCPASFSGSF